LGKNIEKMKIKLLKDINDNYYNVHLKVGDVISVKTNYMYNGGKNITGQWSKEMLILVHGHGAYTYTRDGEWEFYDSKDI
jgi:hypothetical protein